MAIFTILRAVFGYLFLVLVVRIVGRRPGKQLTPFEFVLIFDLGGLTLTGMVGMEVSITNAVCQILTVALCHYGLAALRYRSDLAAQLLDGVPLILLENLPCTCCRSPSPASWVRSRWAICSTRSDANR